MQVIGNAQELKRILDAQIVQWLQQLKDELPKILKQYIVTEYYEQYTPSDLYERQYRILSAIMSSTIKKTGNSYYLYIYLDPTKVSYDPSIWGYASHGGVSYGYIKGDTAETVFQNIANGIHGYPECGETEGRFWEEFLEAIGQGGIYDIFVKFKEKIDNKYFFSI